jgi:hypothetical protein
MLHQGIQNHGAPLLLDLHAGQGLCEEGWGRKSRRCGRGASRSSLEVARRARRRGSSCLVATHGKTVVPTVHQPRFCIPARLQQNPPYSNACICICTTI